MDNLVKYKEIAKKIRRRVVELLYKHNACHLGSCMSCIEILVALYFGKIMKHCGINEQILFCFTKFIYYFVINILQNLKKS